MNSLSEIIDTKTSDQQTLNEKRKRFLKSKRVGSKNSWSKYESKCEDLTRTFDDVPDSEKLIYDCTCAFQKDILHQGRLYICLNGLYFQAHVFRKDILVVVKWKDVSAMKRSKTAKFIPNAILIETKTDSIFFTSFATRDKTFLLVHRLWLCALSQIEMASSEMNLWIQYYNHLKFKDGSRSNTPQSLKHFKNKIRNCLKFLQQNLSDNFVQELQFSKEKPDDHGGDSTFAGLNLLSLPSSFEASNLDIESNDGSDVFMEESQGISSKSRSPSPLMKLKKNGLFPMRKTRSRSFLENESHKDEDKRGRKEKEIKDGETGRRMSLQISQERLNLCSDESEQDSDTLCQCGGHEELPELVMDNVYPMDVNILFKNIFHENCFWSKLLKLRNAKDVVLSPWTTESDGGGASMRNITYTLSLNNSFGPKHSPTVEKQVLHAESNPGEFYLVDSECVNNGLPYGEDFYIVNRYCISKISEGRCRIRITSQIRYRKHVWGVVKSFIDKNATAGILETFNIMGRLLRQEASQVDESVDPPAINNNISTTRKKLLKRKPLEKPIKSPKKTFSDENHKSSPVIGPISATINKSSAIVKQFVDSVRQRQNKRWMYIITFVQAVHFVTALACVLCLFNIFLYFKMHALESITTQFEAQFQQERASVMDELNAVHSFTSRLESEGDITRWKKTMSSLVIMMEDIVQSMSQLENIVDPKYDTKTNE